MSLDLRCSQFKKEQIYWNYGNNNWDFRKQFLSPVSLNETFSWDVNVNLLTELRPAEHLSRQAPSLVVIMQEVKIILLHTSTAHLTVLVLHSRITQILRKHSEEIQIKIFKIRHKLIFIFHQLTLPMMLPTSCGNTQTGNVRTASHVTKTLNRISYCTCSKYFKMYLINLILLMNSICWITTEED